MSRVLINYPCCGNSTDVMLWSYNSCMLCYDYMTHVCYPHCKMRFVGENHLDTYSCTVAPTLPLARIISESIPCFYWNDILEVRNFRNSSYKFEEANLKLLFYKVHPCKLVKLRELENQLWGFSIDLDHSEKKRGKEGKILNDTYFLLEIWSDLILLHVNILLNFSPKLFDLLQMFINLSFDCQINQLLFLLIYN